MNSLGMSVEQLVHRAWKLKAEIDVLEATFKDVRKALVDEAKERRGKENTVTLDGPDFLHVKAKVRFTQSVSFDSRALFAALEILKARRFAKLFSQTTIYRALPALEKFLKTKGNVGARRAIAAATTVTDNTPKVTFEEAE